MQIAEIRTVAKSLPPLRWNTHKSLILSYSADFSVIFWKKTLSLHHGKYDRDFHERGTGYFYNGIVSSAVRHSHELCHDSRLQDIINSKTKNMKKNFVRLRWFFTMLLFVTTMIMPSMMLAKSITPTRPKTGDGSAKKPYQISSREELYWFAGLVNGTLPEGEAVRKLN